MLNKVPQNTKLGFVIPKFTVSLEHKMNNWSIRLYLDISRPELGHSMCMTTLWFYVITTEGNCNIQYI